jgi:DNA-binding protein H-NS
MFCPIAFPVRNRNHEGLNMASYKELRLQAEELMRQADMALAEERAEGIKKAMAIINEYELTAHDLGFIKTQHVKAKKDPKAKTFSVKVPSPAAPPKYRDPASGKTWSGRGHQPHWIEGNRDDYLIDHEKSKKKAA